MNEKASGSEREKRTLQIVLVLNAAIAIAFLLTGALGDSSALIANGLDNLSDAAVYALSLVALSHGLKWKTRAATASGVMLLVFAAGVLFDVGRRYFEGSEPIGPTMMIMSAVAAVVNYACLKLLQRIQDPDVNLRAATTFSYNDFIWPLLAISDQNLQVVTVGLTQFRNEFGTVTWGPRMAAYAVSSIPLVLLFAAGMRFYVRGLTSGAVKG